MNYILLLLLTYLCCCCHITLKKTCKNSHASMCAHEFHSFSISLQYKFCCCCYFRRPIYLYVNFFLLNGKSIVLSHLCSFFFIHEWVKWGNLKWWCLGEKTKRFSSIISQETSFNEPIFSKNKLKLFRGSLYVGVKN